MKNSSNTNYIQILGIVTQMIVLMALGFWGGYQLDQYLGEEKPFYTLIIGLTFMFASLYLTILRVNKIFEEDDNEEV